MVGIEEELKKQRKEVERYSLLLFYILSALVFDFILHFVLNSINSIRPMTIIFSIIFIFLVVAFIFLVVIFIQFLRSLYKLTETICSNMASIKEELRKRRKEVLIFSVLLFLYAFVRSNFGPVPLLHIALPLQIFWAIIFIFLIVAFARSLYKLTKIVYSKPTGYFIEFFLLISVVCLILGFSLGVVYFASEAMKKIRL